MLSTHIFTLVLLPSKEMLTSSAMPSLKIEGLIQVSSNIVLSKSPVPL